MARLYIKNIGPITEADIEIKRFNFFIGPQSSGKSTIAKIISYCSWVEKEVCTTLSNKAFSSREDFIKNIESFHKLSGFFKNDSEIIYKSDDISIVCTCDDFYINQKERYSYLRKKILYIPAERNIAIMPEIEKFSLPANNLRSFLFDWIIARKNYADHHSVGVLNLGVNYYSVENNGIVENRIQHKNGHTYEIPLGNASSGLQSVVPLTIMVDYFTGKFYNDDIKDSTFINEDKKSRLSDVLFKEKIIDVLANKSTSLSKDNNTILGGFFKDVKSNNPEYVKMMNDFFEVFEKLSITYSTTFIIEEPEQNLFPTTQRDLLFFLFDRCLKDRKHSFTITTHSPYILSSLNLILFAWKVSQIDGNISKMVTNILGDHELCNPNDVSAFSLSIDNGVEYCSSLIDSKTQLVSQNELDKVSEYISSDFDKLYKLYINAFNRK